MSKRFAAFISWLFHPLLFPTYGTLFIIAANPHLFGFYPVKAQMLWPIIIFIFTFVCPVMFVAIMKGLEMIDNFNLENSKDKIIPYVAVASFYIWMFKLFKPTTEATPYTNQLISLMMLGAFFSISTAFFINIFKKISIHAIAAGAFLGLMLSIMKMSDFDLRVFFIFSLLIAGLIGTARLVASDTQEDEIWAGYITGFIGQFFSFTLIQMIIT
jgi:hypothetical protein